MVKYVKGDATKPVGDGPKMIVHIVNDEGLWGAGFVLALDKMHPRPREWYMEEVANVKRDRRLFLTLGSVDFVPAGHDITVVNMVAQHRTIRTNPRPICYKSLEACLEKVAAYALVEGATVHMPRIGCGLAGGKWDVVESIINRTLTLKDIDVTVYDL
jgi:O-acetyl-ADP-ribose deacetylase (regulator of RNase III)